MAEQLVELTKLRQHYAAEVAAVNNLERELRASHAATQAETTALSISARLRRFHRCKKIGGLMLRAKNAPRLSRPNRSFLPRQGLTPTPDQRLLRKPLVALVAARQNQLLRRCCSGGGLRARRGGQRAGSRVPRAAGCQLPPY